MEADKACESIENHVIDWLADLMVSHKWALFCCCSLQSARKQIKAQQTLFNSLSAWLYFVGSTAFGYTAGVERSWA